MLAPILTIDGPSGAGKGTVSRLVAKKLGWHYLDSGSIYRSVAIAIQNASVDLVNTSDIVKITQAMVLEFECGDALIVKLNGVDITDQLGLESTGNIASQVAAIPEVRAILLQKQKDFRQLPGLVADGRDMGTVVFPDAENKVFLTASAEKRAERRYKQLQEEGKKCKLEDILQLLKERDLRDSMRIVDPLMVASDAFVIDTSNMDQQEVIAEIKNYIELS